VLAESFRDHNEDSRFVALIVDDPGRELSEDEPFEPLIPTDLGIPVEELHRMATMYTAQALVSALKPHLLRFLLGDQPDPVILLDADGCVYASLAPVYELADEHTIVLSPHYLDPQPLAGDFGPEQSVLLNGVMNGGFLALARGAEPFLDWWCQRTARHSIVDRTRALYLSQNWLTLVPTYFEHHILRDPGCNVMGQNLGRRDVEWRGDVPLIEGGPLRYFHFAAKFDPEHPHRFAAFHRFHPGFWPTLDERPGAARLCREYARRVLARGYREAKHVRPLYDATPCGAPLEPWMRACYREGLVGAEERGEAEPPNPFSDDPSRFLSWIETYAAAKAPETRARRPGGDLSSEADLLRAELEWLSRAHASEHAGRVAAESRADDAESRLADAERRIAELAGRLQEVLSSRSWKLTQPLRGARAAIRQARRTWRDRQGAPGRSP
jgi:hypothetical protein